MKLFSIFLIYTILHAQGLGLAGPGPGTVHGSTLVTSTCGETTTAGATAQSSAQDYILIIQCITGANAGGYSVVDLQVHSATASGKVFTAIYADTTSMCAGGATHCPGTKICSESTGVNALANAWTTDTPSGCGTLAASTRYWIGQSRNNNVVEVEYQSGNCPGTSNPGHYVNTGDPAGTWPSPLGDSVEGSACYLAFMTLGAL